MNAPDKAVEIKAAIAAIIAFVTALVGYTGWAIIVWFIAMVLDYGTGTWAAMAKGEWSSAVARQGLWHKLGEIMAILVAALCDIALSVLITGTGVDLPFEFTSAVLPIVALWYIFTELGSVIENAALLGAPIPEWLTKLIARCKKTTETAFDVEDDSDESTDKKHN